MALTKENKSSDCPKRIETIEDILRFLKSEALGFALGEDKCQLKEAIELLERYESRNASYKNPEMSTEKFID